MQKLQHWKNRIVIETGMRKKKTQMHTEKLIAACRKDDSRAQLEIYKRYYRSMYSIALRILNDTAEAEDVMQESFLKAFDKIGTYKGEVTFGAWLKKIVINRSLDVLKARKSMISLEMAEEPVSDEEGETWMNYRGLEISTVKEVISSLPDGYRVVLSLYLIEGYDHEEISEILSITNATSRTQYHRARKLLAKKLNELKAVS